MVKFLIVDYISKQTPRKENVYDSARRGHPAIDEFREILNYRTLVWQLTRRDVVTRYKRSFLGIAWTMLNPLGMMIVLTIAFSSIFRFETDYGYPAYVLSGLIAWNFFSQTTTAAMINLVWGGGLLHRIYIPRTAFAIAANATGLVNTFIALVPVILVMLVTNVPIKATILLLPLMILILAIFSLGVGLAISTFAVYFPDIAEMYSIALTGLMYLTPIIYPIKILPETYQFWIMHLNPMYHFINLFRIPLYYGRIPTFSEFLPPLLISIGTFALGWFVFTKKADEFSYRI